MTYFFPAYVVNGSQYGITKMTSLTGSDKGISARAWQDATSDRLIALFTAYGKRYNSHPNVEMVTTGETALAVTPGQDGFSNEQWVKQLKRLIAAARAAWPNTAVRVSANDLWPDSLMVDTYNTCLKAACAIGGPDIWPATVTQSDRIFAGLNDKEQKVYADLRDQLPWAIEIQSPELAGQWTPKQLYDATMYGYYATQDKYNVPSMKPKYIIWYVNTGWTGGPAQAWSTGELPFIKSVKGAVHSTACPTAYPACITD
jgi:hypothetical protein